MRVCGAMKVFWFDYLSSLMLSHSQATKDSADEFIIIIVQIALHYQRNYDPFNICLWYIQMHWSFFHLFFFFLQFCYIKMVGK